LAGVGEAAGAVAEGFGGAGAAGVVFSGAGFTCCAVLVTVGVGLAEGEGLGEAAGLAGIVGPGEAATEIDAVTPDGTLPTVDVAALPHPPVTALTRNSALNRPAILKVLIMSDPCR
jgi:hypothetical protein